MLTNLFLTSILTAALSLGSPSFFAVKMPPVVLAEKQFSLENRYGNKYVSDIFKDNILLNMAYLNGSVQNKSDIDWSEVQKPFTYEFTLEPNETFAYHNLVLEQYQNKVKLTTNANFNQQDGFKTDGYLYGDGVCHLASIINWAAKDANLKVLAPRNHDFAVIPEVPKEYGVAIYYDPNGKSNSAQENLYITNNQDKPVKFVFEYKDNNLKVSVIKIV